ncbi:bifunctional hydroxymethylpyrimidine kinase/phosphomethylpyrimidine kinase [Corynebacterium timonense]|uniref:Thiamine biosynthesis multifunctional protein ThiED n=1 Tax=Corynebacterium timonense TaxID=441500 RepID=A0A1H1SRU1_9CORY|nr:bifunctional hydroxymethylpyrimidine kinase/phosphomethylpyrimidine kinase [Corynebacterium timonense]SDS50578.1 hydroxymethylpyrimidine/phosphomethylpyrimidine kinase [Corynebacterium timonense]
MTHQPRVLSIAGTDPTGGAGIQADLKSIAASGGYGMCVVTALVAQNTRGVREVHTPPTDFLVAQLEAVFDDVAVDAVKVGMLGSAEITRTVNDFLAAHPVDVVVIDPVMVATSGDRLLSEDAEDSLRDLVRAHASVVTPNIPELAILAGASPATTFDAALEQGAALAADLDVQVLVKGGHLDAPEASNALVTPSGEVHVTRLPRLETTTTHGTGCSLSAALATRLLLDASPAAAAEHSTRWLHDAIAGGAALNVGEGHGPVDHMRPLRRLAAAADTTPWNTDPAPASEPRPRIAAAGPHTADLWGRAAARAWPDTLGLSFLAELRAGTLPARAFEFYLSQDAYYLSEYARALSLVASKAPSRTAHEWWSAAATGATAEEASLHREWLSQRGLGEAAQSPSPVTLAYVSHLKAATATGDYAVAAAAVLPCFWLYAEVGLHLADADHPDHPYHAWLSLYGGEDFVAETSRAIELTEQALDEGSPAQRKAAREAFMHSCFFEREFFDQAARLQGVTR